jgi:hypothetical protein
MKLALQQVPARQGVQWIRSAFALFARKPLAMSVLLMAYLLLAFVLLFIPVIGPLLALAGWPLLGLAYMAATRDALADLPVSPMHLAEPLGAEHTATRMPLLIICGLYALLTALLMVASDAIDGGSFTKLQQLMAQERTEAVRAQTAALLDEPELLVGLWLRFGGMALLSLPFWFAPALVSWQGQGVAQALFSSTLALWRNKGAYLACVAGFMAVVMVFSAVTGLVFAMLGLPMMAVAAALPAGLIFTSVFYVSLYFGWRDTFAITDESTTLTASDV